MSYVVKVEVVLDESEVTNEGHARGLVVARLTNGFPWAEKVSVESVERMPYHEYEDSKSPDGRAT